MMEEEFKKEGTMKWVPLFLIVVSILPEAITMAGEPTPQPTWLQYWREATVAIGNVKKAKVTLPTGEVSERNIFAVVGTGVIFGLLKDESKTPWLVTAKHVFYDSTMGWDPEVIRLRFAWFENRPVEDYLGIEIKLKDQGKRLWSAHPTASVDLAAIPLRITTDLVGRQSVPFVPFANFATAEDIYEGASVIVFGYPGAVGFAFWAKALVRSGVIAWVNPNDPAGERLIIDSMIFPGNSGGPVFKIPTGLDRYGSFHVGGKPVFLGIIVEGRKQPMPLMAEGKKIEIQGVHGPIESEQWIGVGIIEPPAQVAKLLEAAMK